jgi:hypothetical protein
MITKDYLKYFIHILSIFCLSTSIALSANSGEEGENDFIENAARAKKANHSRQYFTFNYPAPGGDTFLTGIRRAKSSAEIVYISGVYRNGSNSIGFVYKGDLFGNGKWHELNYPSSPGVTVTSTSLYGPNNGKGNHIQVVGNYNTAETGQAALGCLYEGPLDGSGKWTTLIPFFSQPTINTIAHSTMGGFVVGNYDTELIAGKAFLYDIERKKYYDIVKPGAISITAYGIWHNGGDSYTICGGYSEALFPDFESGYLVDWNKKTKKFHNWRSYNYNNDPVRAIVTHFDGITSDGEGGYYLTGDWIGIERGPEGGFFCHVKKGSKNRARWSPIQFPDHPITSGNSIYKKVVIGVYTSVEDQRVNGYISFP